jgi:hypothetical protein
MGERLGRSTAWALIAAGIAGLVLTLATLPTIWALASGQAAIGFFMGMQQLPRWAWWHTISLTGAPLIVGAMLCGLILATGRTVSRLLAIGGVIWFLWATTSFASGSYWVNWMALKGDATPLTYQITGFGIVLGLLSITAILIAARAIRAQPDENTGSG